MFTLSQGSIDPLNHQLELLASLTLREPIRALIADEVGLGKTMEAALVVKYYSKIRERNPLVLIVVPRVLLEQWKEELREKFDVEVKELRRDNLREVKAMPLRDKWYIISIDLMKRKENLKELKSVPWNFIIVDEAHKLGYPKGQKPTQRYEAVKALSRYNNVNLLLLTATPHRGDPLDYLARLRLIDPYLSLKLSVLVTEDFYHLTRNSIVFRRTKLDINEIYEKREVFKNASYKAYIVKSSACEKEFYEKALELVKMLIGGKKRGA